MQKHIACYKNFLRPQCVPQRESRLKIYRKHGNNGELNHSVSLTPRILYDVHLSKYCISPNIKGLRIERNSLFPVGLLREKDLEENINSHCELWQHLYYTVTNPKAIFMCSIVRTLIRSKIHK